MRRPYVAILLLVILSIGLGIALISRNNEASRLKKQNTNLLKQNSDLQKQTRALAGKINEANSTINELSTNGSFLEGSACQPQQLSLTLENDKQHNPGGAAGTVGQLFSYQNVSKSTCTVQGYPGFLALDNKGYVVPDGPIQTGVMGLITKLVSLPPNQKAYFVVTWNHTQPATNQRCINPSLIESTPPGTSAPIISTVSNSLEICGLNISISALGSRNDF